MNLKLVAFAAITVTFAGSAFANDASVRDTRSYRDGTLQREPKAGEARCLGFAVSRRTGSTRSSHSRW